MTTRKNIRTKNKTCFFVLGLVLVCGVLITSCKDEFEAEQLLVDQAERSDQIAQREADEKAAEQLAEEELSAENAAALAAAANLTYTINLFSDDVPVVDVDVMLTNQNGGSIAAVTTDTNGNAVFVDIDLGGYNVAITSDNYLNASYLVDFGSPQEGVHYEWINGSIIALEQTEASRIELLELNGTQTATIEGKVEIETDLTNNTPEVPQDITIRANLDNFNGMFEHTNNSFNGSNDTDSFYITGSFSLTEGDIGSANVDPNTGDYTMQVPAQENGTTIELLFPLIEANQTLAFSSINGQDVGAQVGTQAAVFGPDIAAATTPKVPGVTATFPTPPEPGRGFNLSLNTDRYPEDLLSIGSGVATIDEFPVQLVEGTWFRASRGSGYQVTPLITLSAQDIPTGDPAMIEAWMDWTFESVTYTAQPAATYGVNEQLYIFVEILDENGVRDTYDFARINAEADGSLVASTVDLDPNINIFYGPVPAELITEYVVTGFNIIISGGGNSTGTLTRSGSVDAFRIVDDGDSVYINIPTIIVAPAPAQGTDATLAITDWESIYTYNLDNSNISTPYVVLPEISYEYEVDLGVTTVDDRFRVTWFNSDGSIGGDDLIQPSRKLPDALITANNGLLFDNDNFFGNTDIDVARPEQASYTPPKIIIIEPTHEQTTADVLVNSDGEITGIANIFVGKGYNTIYDVTLTTLDGLPGSGAVLDLVDFDTDERTGEVTWGGNANDFIVVDRGSGYTLDVNIVEEPFTPGTASQVITVKNGETKIVNVNYGTGKPVAELE
ncbi:hypothetical protein [Flagellimonas eckloniae]|uniref:Carboxypeptidase regulatory-like domain-containing protein n=1 Tax=Flagellimonas eckloniae TaxID=346185 RepID=A0A0N8WFL0_9FLAO|nr:hypothetical protein [Allomuricauda eckloniae]KQC28995.1 hypothetical protein AAY42_03105 [Allomuricauda eckloniae]